MNTFFLLDYLILQLLISVQVLGQDGHHAQALVNSSVTELVIMIVALTVLPINGLTSSHVTAV